MDKKLGGREYLVRKLKRRGLSRRRSVKILNLFFAEIKEALARGEEVEFPLGKLVVERHKHRTQSGDFLNRKLTTYKQPFTVELKTNRKGDWLLNAKPLVIPPKPGSPSGAKPIVVDPRKLKFKGKLVLPPKPWLKNAK